MREKRRKNGHGNGNARRERKLSNTLYVYQPVVRFWQKPYQPVVRFWEAELKKPRFGRVPDSVGSDGRLTHADVRIYWGLARCAITSGAVVKVGKRQIARTSCASLSQVQKSIDILVELGHLKEIKGSNGKRSEYILTSSVFRPSRPSEETIWQGGGLKVTKTKQERKPVLEAKAATGTEG